MELARQLELQLNSWQQLRLELMRERQEMNWTSSAAAGISVNWATKTAVKKEAEIKILNKTGTDTLERELERQVELAL